MKMYAVTAWDLKVNEIVTLIVDAQGFKKLYWSYWYNIISTREARPDEVPANAE